MAQLSFFLDLRRGETGPSLFKPSMGDLIEFNTAAPAHEIASSSEPRSGQMALLT